MEYNNKEKVMHVIHERNKASDKILDSVTETPRIFILVGILVETISDPCSVIHISLNSEYTYEQLEHEIKFKLINEAMVGIRRDRIEILDRGVVQKVGEGHIFTGKEGDYPSDVMKRTLMQFKEKTVA